MLLFVAATGSPAGSVSRGNPLRLTAKHSNSMPLEVDNPTWHQARLETDKILASHGDLAKWAREQAYHKVFLRGPAREKVLYLTFDDGPHKGKTDKLLALLDELHVKATFFVVGMMAQKSPDLVREIEAHGNVVGNHSFSHADMSELSFAQAYTEFLACNNQIFSITGHRPTLCRPPGGRLDTTVLTAAGDLGLTTVMWTDDPGDYKSPGARAIYDRVVKGITPGGVILLHDGIPDTWAALPGIVAYARSRGYVFKLL